MMLKCVLYLWFSLLVKKAFSDSELDFVILNETEFTRTEYVRTTYLKAARFNSGYNDPFADEYFQDEEDILKANSADTLIEYVKEGVQTLRPLLSHHGKVKTELREANKIAIESLLTLYSLANKSVTLYDTAHSSSPITADFYDITLRRKFSFGFKGNPEQLWYAGDITVNGRHNFQIDGQSFAGNFSYDIVGLSFSLRQSESMNRLSYMFEIEELLKYDEIGNGNVTFLPDAKTKDDLLMRKLHFEAFLKSNLPPTILSKVTDLNKLSFVRQMTVRNLYLKLIKTYEKKIIPNVVNLIKLFLKKTAIEKDNSTVVTSDIRGKPIRFENIDKFWLDAPMVSSSFHDGLEIILRAKAVYNDSKAFIHYESKTLQVNSITLAFKANLTSPLSVNVDFSESDISRGNYSSLVLLTGFSEFEDFNLIAFDPVDFVSADVNQSTKDTLNLFVKQVSLTFIREALKKYNEM